MATQPPNEPYDVAVIVAAGRGSRVGGGLPKQYRMLAGMPVLTHTLRAIADGRPDIYILPVIHADDVDLFEACRIEDTRLLPPVFGGAARQESVRNALNALQVNPPNLVYIHDAARAFVSEGLLTRLAKAMKDGAVAAVPVLPVVDTLVRKTNGGVSETVDRSGLHTVQTPQVFDYQQILKAHHAAIHDGYTDDASIFEAYCGNVTYIDGCAHNFKITTSEDFKKAEGMLMTLCNDIRTGNGFDVHRFDDGDHVWLCGVKIPFTHSLQGHSDADVALHALTDAILASIADGDIGMHFPPSDKKWRGASSDTFLSFAVSRVRALGGIIANMAITIICEQPKIGPHMNVMRARISEITDVEIGRISVQATTTEKLGFTGRGEGIAAQAMATVRLPNKAEQS